MEVKNSKKVVFILSETRSGSTWLSYVLGSHENSIHLGEFYRPFTMPGHTACRLCSALGKRDCDYLYGIEEIPAKEAFRFAFERFNANTLIDCSKQIGWLKNFVGSNSFDIKVIHLLRDPRAWFASERRRSALLKINDAMDRWVKNNIEISHVVNELEVKYTTAFYEELCLMPDYYFKTTVSDHIDLPFDINALDYWKKKHHGLGGNGAALNNLKDCPLAQVKTAHDDFYKSSLGKRFYDSRWLKEISSLERLQIEQNKDVKKYLELHKRDFLHFDKLRKKK